ncbi:MAG: hypothetical protein ACT4OG_06375 [Alphaproteobacteria bacterium]
MTITINKRRHDSNNPQKEWRKKMKLTTSIAIAVLLAAVAAPAFAQPDPATIIKMCDRNDDGSVTQQEWDACGAPTSYPGSADANQDGKITADELAGGSLSGDKPPAAPR